MKLNPVSSFPCLLRGESGDKLFREGFKEYTQKYWRKSVEKKDFQNAVEKAIGKDLSKFSDYGIYLNGN